MSSRQPLTPQDAASLKVRAARKALGYTRIELAVALNISDRTLAEYETAAAPVRRVVMLALEGLLRRNGHPVAADALLEQRKAAKP